MVKITFVLSLISMLTGLISLNSFFEKQNKIFARKSAIYMFLGIVLVAAGAVGLDNTLQTIIN